MKNDTIRAPDGIIAENHNLLSLSSAHRRVLTASPVLARDSLFDHVYIGFCETNLDFTGGLGIEPEPYLHQCRPAAALDQVAAIAPSTLARFILAYVQVAILSFSVRRGC